MDSKSDETVPDIGCLSFKDMNPYDTQYDQVIEQITTLYTEFAIPSVVIMRGLPGSGKSTLCNYFQYKLFPVFKTNRAVYSTDNYFKDPKTNEYKFDGKKITEYHRKNLEAFTADVQHHKSGLVIVDNTNIQRFEFSGYIQEARKAGYIVHMVNAPFSTKVEHCVKHNTHNVPQKTIEERAKKFDVAHPLYFGLLFQQRVSEFVIGSVLSILSLRNYFMETYEFHTKIYKRIEKIKQDEKFIKLPHCTFEFCDSKARPKGNDLVGIKQTVEIHYLLLTDYTLSAHGHLRKPFAAVSEAYKNPSSVHITLFVEENNNAVNSGLIHDRIFRPKGNETVVAGDTTIQKQNLKNFQVSEFKILNEPCTTVYKIDLEESIWLEGIFANVY